MKRKHHRLVVIVAALAALGLAAGLILWAMRDNLVFFITPSEAAARQIAPGAKFRIGGLVAIGSVEKSADGLDTAFAVSDGAAEIMVRHHGLLPDLFREGQGVVAEGGFDGEGRFIADRVLAKHDERYMPKEVVDALKASGNWHEGDAP